MAESVIQLKRQLANSSGAVPTPANAKAPSSGHYGEIQVDSAGYIYTANSTNRVVSQVRNAMNVLFLYGGTLTNSGWTKSGDTWIQEMIVVPCDGGPAMSANFTLGQPLTPLAAESWRATIRQDLLYTLQCGTITPSAGKVIFTTKQNPTYADSDIDVYFYARLAGGYDSMVSPVQVGSIVDTKINAAIDDLNQTIIDRINEQFNDSTVGQLILNNMSIYYATYTLTGWSEISTNGFTYQQTVTVNKVNSSSPDIDANSIFLTTGFFLPTGVASTDDNLAKSIAIINSGYSISQDGNKIVTQVTQKPATEVTVRWVVQKA